MKKGYNSITKMLPYDPISREFVGITNNALDVSIQDQTTKTVDIYALMTKDDNLTLTEEVSVNDISIKVSNIITAIAGEAIEFIEGDNIMQAIIVSVVDNTTYRTINISTPLDYAYNNAKIRTGSWNMNVDGSTENKTFSFRMTGYESIDIYTYIVSMEDNAVMYDSTFGGINALTNGLIARQVDGGINNLFTITNNGGFREAGYTLNYDSKVPSGTYALFGVKNTSVLNGVARRLSGSENDEIQFIVRDDLTGITKLTFTAHGHIVIN